MRGRESIHFVLDGMWRASRGAPCAFDFVGVSRVLRHSVAIAVIVRMMRGEMICPRREDEAARQVLAPRVSDTWQTLERF